VLQKNRTEPSTEIWSQKPIETDRKRKILHRNNTRYLVRPFRNIANPHSTSVQNKITLCPYRRSVTQRNIVRYA